MSMVYHQLRITAVTIIDEKLLCLFSKGSILCILWLKIITALYEGEYVKGE